MKRVGAFPLCVTLSILIVGGLTSCASQPSKVRADRETIRQVVLIHKKQVSRCYEDAIDRRPGAEGKVRAAWVIIEDGSVSEAKILEATPKITEVTDCLLETIRGWKFPPPEDGRVVEVTYPFFFSENGKFPSLEEK